MFMNLVEFFQYCFERFKGKVRNLIFEVVNTKASIDLCWHTFKIQFRFIKMLTTIYCLKKWFL